MTAVEVLAIAVLALVLSGASVWAAVARRRNHRSLDALAERLSLEARIDAMTTQTLIGMREAVRRSGSSR